MDIATKNGKAQKVWAVSASRLKNGSARKDGTSPRPHGAILIDYYYKVIKVFLAVVHLDMQMGFLLVMIRVSRLHPCPSNPIIIVRMGRK